MRKEVKIIKQVFTTPSGLRESYGVIVNCRPRFVYDSKREVQSFLDGLNG